MRLGVTLASSKTANQAHGLLQVPVTLEGKRDVRRMRGTLSPGFHGSDHSNFIGLLLIRAPGGRY